MPPPLKSFRINSKRFDPNMTATEAWSFFRYLPMAIGCAIPHESKAWALFLNLQEVVDLAIASIQKHPLTILKAYMGTFSINSRSFLPRMLCK